jgi:hypothetical protein
MSMTNSGRLLLRSGGVGALVALAAYAVALGALVVVPAEDLAEFVVIAAVLLALVALLPAAGALYWLFRPVAPTLSRGLLLFGGLGLAAYALLPFIYIASATPTAPDLRLQPVVLLWSLLMLAHGAWPMLAGVAGVKHVPSQLAMSVSGFVGGLAWMGFVLSVLGISRLPNFAPAFTPLLLLSLLTLLPTQALWLLGLARWLLRGTPAVSTDSVKAKRPAA